MTNVSGRGVGMDVVRSNVESIGGSISLFSMPGRGSRFSLKIPLTLAIAPALIITLAGQRFALPQHAVVEAVGLGKNSRHVIEKVQNALVLKLREDVVPVADLRTILGLGERSGTDAGDHLVVIMRVGSNSFGIIVDGVSDVQEIVVKPLSASLSHLKIFSGHTILGDGSVVLILDPAGIGLGIGIDKAEKQREAIKEGPGTADSTRLVLFRAGPGVPKMLPLSLVARIEMVDATRIERAGGRFVMLYQGRLMPILPVAPMAEISRAAHPVLVITAGDRTIGLLVDEIIDIIEERLDIQLATPAPETIGAAEIRGRPTELLDIGHFFKAAWPESSAEAA